MWIVGAEWRPSDHGFIHDRAQRPPVAAKGIALPAEDLGCNVIGGADRGIGHCPPRLAPVFDLLAVADGQVDLVNVDRVTILASGRR